MVLVSYDVAMTDREGAKRLRRVANACKDYGQRVQYSVFECIVDPTQWVKFRARLIEEIDEEQDSLRFYFLGSKWGEKIEQIGAKTSFDQQGPLIV